MTRRRERPSVALLWGGAQRPTRGPKPGLTVDAIVGAAIALADREGLAAVTMQRVAAALDVTTMALYRYVPGKDDLVAVMSDRAIGSAPAPSGSGWRTDLARWARANFVVLQRHPWLFETIAHRVAIGPNWLAWVDAGLRTVASLGLTARERMAVVVLVDGHVRAVAQLSLSGKASQEWAASIGDVIRRVAGDPRYAALAGAAAEGAFDAPAKGEPDAFEFGLERLLDGIETFSRSRPVRSRPRRRRAE